MRTRLLPAAVTLGLAATVTAADANTVATVCVTSERWTFTPRLTVAFTSGTVVREISALCESAYVVTSPGPGAGVDPSSGSLVSTGIWLGNCVLANVSFDDGVNGVLAGGVVFATTGFVGPNSAAAVVLTPDAVCNEKVATGTAVGVALP